MTEVLPVSATITVISFVACWLMDLDGDRFLYWPKWRMNAFAISFCALVTSSTTAVIAAIWRYLP